MTTLNKIVNRVEYENHAATQIELVERVPEKRNQTEEEKYNKQQCIDTESNVATLSVPKDVTIDIEELQSAKSRPENNIIRKWWFNNLLVKNDKQEKESPLQEFKRVENQNEAWVQFSLGHGQGGFGIGSGEGFNYVPGDRNPFIILVLSITTFLLACTALFLYCVRTSESLYETFRHPSVLLIIFAFGGLLICQFCFACIPATREMPCSLILLILTVITMSCVAAIVTGRYETKILLHAFLITAGVTLFCTLLACTSFDFTSFWLYVFGISVAFSIAVAVLMITSAITGEHYKTAHMVMLFIGVIIQIVVLIMELQSILGGRSVELEEDQYILGAYMLYTSIINIFLYVVRLLGLFSDD